MYIKKSIVIVYLTFLVIFANNSFGQNPDTSNYFPHHLGDIWEYVKIDWLASTIDTFQYQIIKDSIDLAGNNHVTEKRYHINPFYDAGKFYFIIDTSGNVYRIYNSYNDSTLLFKRNATVGQYWISEDFGGGYLVGKLIGENQEFIFGNLYSVKEISYFGTSDTSDTTVWLNWYNNKYADGLGLIWSGGGDTWSDMNIIGAVIDSVLFGDTTFITNIEDKERSKILNQFILNQNYPNPFNNQTNISFV